MRHIQELLREHGRRRASLASPLKESIQMKKIALSLVIIFCSSTVLAQSSNSDARAASQSSSGSGATAATGAITFESAQPRESQRLHTTPTIYTPPSMFGGANNCGQSSAVGMGFTGFGIGGSLASESDNCNAREDTSIAYKLGYKEVADMRFFCFGEDLNRMAFEAAGHKCPVGATAKGLPITNVVANQQTLQRNAAIARDDAVVVDLISASEASSKSSVYNGNDPIVMKRLGIVR